MTFVNCCKHAINLNDGTVIQPSGIEVRVSATFTDFDENKLTSQVFGQVENLPDPKDGTFFIVSQLVQTALKGTRSDVVAPATGHREAIRNEQGLVVSVPGFIRS